MTFNRPRIPSTSQPAPSKAKSRKLARWADDGHQPFDRCRVPKAQGIKAMHSSDPSDNARMRQFADHLGFHHQRDPDDATLLLYSVELRAEPAAAST